MSKDTITMIENLELKLFENIDKIIEDSSQDPTILIDDFKIVYNEIKKEIPSEYSITNIQYNIENSLLNDLIVQNTLINGSDVLNDLSPEIAKKYYYLKEIIKSVRHKKLGRLKEFVMEYKIGTELTFLYHELNVLHSILNNEHEKVIPYIREHFVKEKKVNNQIGLSVSDHKEKVKRLLTFLVLPKKAAKYYNIVVNATIMQIKHDFSDKLGIANFACLDVLFAGGSDSIEQLLKMTNVEAEQFGDCLPIDLNIKTKYHSIFICPILKTFCGDENPPMRLVCGHVISNEAVVRLSKNRSILSFKCPYCPNDCRLSDIKQLHL